MEFPSLRFDHGETVALLRETVRGFAAKEIAPRAAEIDRGNEGAGTSEIRRWLIGRELFGETQ
jgi:alkylation response protein AidB-like acyl-CoA dehydrogenase